MSPTSNQTMDNMNSFNENRLIEEFFIYLSYLGKHENKIDIQSLKKYVNDEFTVQSNSETLCQNIEEFIAYANRMKQKYEHVSYSNFLENPIISKDKAVVHFQVDCSTHEGAKSRLDAIAILTIRNGKIASWTEVYHEIEEY
jgi:hypothetical protein